MGGTVPSLEEVLDIFVEHFTARVPAQLHPLASILHRVLGHTLLPRGDNREHVTFLQQRVLVDLLCREPFCVVDFLIAKMEDVITMGYKAKSVVLPYAHFISYMLSRIDADGDAPGPYQEIYMAARPFHTTELRLPGSQLCQQQPFTRQREHRIRGRGTRSLQHSFTLTLSPILQMLRTLLPGFH